MQAGAARVSVEPDGAVQQFIETFWREVGQRSEKRSGRMIDRPCAVATKATVSESHFVDGAVALDHIERGLFLAREAGLGDLADAFEACSDALHWSQNAGYHDSSRKAENSAAFLNNYIYGAMAGPEGPVFLDAPRLGLMVMAPNTLYPSHRHAPGEVYLMLTPGTQWRLDEGDWFEMAAGEVIYHDPWMSHAMRTGSEPMLALTAWTAPGDRNAIEWV